MKVHDFSIRPTAFLPAVGLFVEALLVSHAFLPLSIQPHRGRSELFSSDQEQAVEALRSLVDFHQGNWKGKARSFTVVADTAAGIIKRKTSSEYELSVKLGLNEQKDDYSLTETFLWDEGKFKARSLALSESYIDVDAVDASYSLDFSLPDLPSDIVGTSELSQFAIEHCIAASDDKRMRCFIMYGMDQALQRVVICEETRVKKDDDQAKTDGTDNEQSKPGNMGNQLTAKDLLEMENDVDRLVNKITANLNTGSKDDSSTFNEKQPSKANEEEFQTSAESLFKKLGQSMSPSEDGSRKVSLHDMTLLEVSSGLWLGDAIVRHNPKVPDANASTGRGFDSSSGSSQSSRPSKIDFASWYIGVQKVAWRLMWNFGEEIRQVVDAGKAMGDSMALCLIQSTGGSVCVNESLSRRMAKEDRMVYIDWAAASSVGFLCGPVFLYVPRYLSFEQKGSNPKPFYTEFALCQSTYETKDEVPILPSLGAEIDERSEQQLPELCLSKSSRVYNHEGRLKQGCTSFFTFKRFGIDDLEEER